jgi:hypothetical protein
MLTRCYITTAKEAAIQRPLLSNGFENKHVWMDTIEKRKKEWRFLCGPCRDFIIRTVSEGQLRADSLRNELAVRQSPAGKNVSTEAEDIVGIRDQATASEDTAGLEDPMCPIVICEVY